MSNDLEHLSKVVESWCMDDEFLRMRSKTDIINLLDLCNLNKKEFFEIFNRLHKIFAANELFEIMQHTKVNFVSNIDNAIEVLDFFVRKLDVKLLSNVSYTIKEGMKARSVLTTDENIKNLKKCSKKTEDFPKIYEILSKAAEEGDELTIKTAVDEKYTEIHSNFTFDHELILQAAFEGNVALVKKLQKFYADIRTRDNSEKTVLHLFCISGNVKGVKFALKFIDVNAKDSSGNTPLHLAAQSNRADVCECLLKISKIDKNIKNSANKTPLREAMLYNCKDAVEVLKKYECTI